MLKAKLEALRLGASAPVLNARGLAMWKHIHCKFGWRVTANGRKYVTWELELDGVSIGKYVTAYKAVNALTVRKVPLERALWVCDKSRPKTSSKSITTSGHEREERT